MIDELPPSWTRERTDSYRPTPNSAARRFSTYAHESGEVTLAVAPATLDPTERPGYALTVARSNRDGTEAREVVGSATTARSCERLAREYMRTFDGQLDRTGDVADAVERTTERMTPSAAFDAAAPSVE